MSIKPWVKVGEPCVLAERHGKSFVNQKFINPKTNKVEEFSSFRSKRKSVIIMPITTNNRILVTSQFRHAAENVFLEFPGGNKNPGESSLKAAERELLEETGYCTGEMMRASKIWIDPGVLESALRPFLALNCYKVREPQLDITECIEITTIPIRKWLSMAQKGDITDCKTLAVTTLFLSYLERRAGCTLI